MLFFHHMRHSSLIKKRREKHNKTLNPMLSPFFYVNFYMSYCCYVVKYKDVTNFVKNYQKRGGQGDRTLTSLL